MEAEVNSSHTSQLGCHLLQSEGPAAEKPEVEPVYPLGTIGWCSPDHQDLPRQCSPMAPQLLGLLTSLRISPLAWKTSPTPWHCKPLGCLMCPQQQVPEDKGFKLFTGPGQSLTVSGRLPHQPPAACMAPATLPAAQTNNRAVLEDSAASAPISVGRGVGNIWPCQEMSLVVTGIGKKPESC